MSSLEPYMLPCLWKKTFGMDCLGCGMQRALALVFQGEFSAAFKMYPAIYTLLLLGLFLLAHIKYQFKYGHRIVFALFILNITITLINYYLKHF
ncbi:DUF2752 domain-containing protein [Mangrovimonas sp. YM274]|uniref:DUF2752 domain-containing protein n=1 Tax=Mangrovimonas sp. YM274 TaxID=3070660 RepID=UPI0027DBFA8C|nr:DUF2752 domain-containing protein [Mangrovimonas sp. YM274]WMI67432.1 DUF2752 domain-containing protein [Mangrovimonas sp. YM274]